MIPFKAPPKLSEKGGKKWTPLMHDFLNCCLKKKASERLTAEKLLEHEFINVAAEKLVTNHGKSELLSQMLTKTLPIIEKFRETGAIVEEKKFEEMCPELAYKVEDMETDGSITPASSSSQKAPLKVDTEKLRQETAIAAITANTTSATAKKTSENNGTPLSSTRVKPGDVTKGLVSDRIKRFNTFQREDSLRQVRNVAAANTRPVSSVFDAARPLSAVFRAGKPEVLVSVDLRAEKVASIRQTLNNTSDNAKNLVSRSIHNSMAAAMSATNIATTQPSSEGNSASASSVTAATTANAPTLAASSSESSPKPANGVGNRMGSMTGNGSNMRGSKTRSIIPSLVLPVKLSERQSAILKQATMKKKLTIDELFELLAQPPLTQDEKGGLPPELEEMITTRFVEAITGLI